MMQLIVQRTVWATTFEYMQDMGLHKPHSRPQKLWALRTLPSGRPFLLVHWPGSSFAQRVGVRRPASEILL